MNEVPLKPLGREDIHKLESVLLVGTLLRKEVLDLLREPSERLTWVDSLAVAAAALARERAGMSAAEIADELGRTEATIRNHLAGKTKAGLLVKETFERFSREGVKIEVEPIAGYEELEKLKAELEEEKKMRTQLEEKLKRVRERLQQILGEI